jgi:formylmethanofuran dehydrogenase subunit C
MAVLVLCLCALALPAYFECMLQLTLISPTKLPIELSSVRPDALLGRSLLEIERILISHGRQKLPLAELFTVNGDAGDEEIEFNGDLSSANGIGAGMTGGRIHVVDNAGNCVGLGMFAGEIEVTGDAGYSLGAEMRGGVIHVAGSAGDYVGGAQVGSVRGMTGGAIFVQGNVGDFVGTRMRRGLIAIGGDVGEYAGYKMLAGTIVVIGKCGSHAGASMNRGTLWMGQAVKNLLPTFSYACTSRPAVLGMIARELSSLGFDTTGFDALHEWRQYSGDLTATGRGEIFVPMT